MNAHFTCARLHAAGLSLAGTLLTTALLQGCASAWLPITHTAAAPQTDASLGRRVREAMHLQTLKPGPSSDAQLPQRQSAQEVLNARRSHAGHHGATGVGMGMHMGAGADGPAGLNR